MPSRDNKKANKAKKSANTVLEGLITQFNGGLFGYINTQVRNAADAEDLVDDVWLDVCKMVRAGTIDFARAGGLVYRIAHCKCIDLLRRRHRNPVRQNDGADDWDGAGGVASAHDATTRDEDACRVRAAMDKLPRAERSVVYLRYFEDMTLQDIADVLGVSGPPQVSRILGRATAKMEEMLS